MNRTFFFFFFAIIVACLVVATQAQQLCSDLGISVSEQAFPTDPNLTPAFQFTSFGIMMVTNTGGLYMSFDAGDSWTNQLPFLPQSDVLFPGAKRSGVKSVAQQGNHSDTLYAIGFGPIAWVTTNGGRTYSVIDYFVSMGVDSVSFYASPLFDGGLLGLAVMKQSGAPNIYSLHVSYDYGYTFSFVDRDVYTVVWNSISNDADSFIYKKCPMVKNSYFDPNAPGNPYDCQAWKATDLAKNMKSIFPHAADIKTKQGFVVISTYTNSNMTSVNLWGSTDGAASFNQLKLGSAIIKNGDWNLPSIAYLDTNFIMLNTTKPGELPNGALYTPDDRSGYMSISLSNIVYPKSNPMSEPGGHFYAGVLLSVNVYDGKPTPGTGIQTFVSYNQGGSWSRVTTSADCSPSECFLNIDQFATGNKFDAGSAGILFTDGNTGSYLGAQSPKTFLTDDWGNSWKTFQNYPSEYTFVDGGALGVWGRNDAPTNQIGFSWAINSPEKRINCQFTDTPFLVSDIISSDDDNAFTTTTVIVYGVRTISNLPVGVIVTLDFGNYPISQCASPETAGEIGSDYEVTQPIDPDGSDCVLGRSYVFRRKSPTKECYDSVASASPIISTERCACTEDDYECDYCYERDSSNRCVLQNGCSKYTIKGLCTNGYSLIEGDVCNDDRGLNRIPSCSKTGGVVVGVVFLLITFITLVFLYVKNQKFKDFVRNLPSRVISVATPEGRGGRTNSALSKYETVAQDEELSLFDSENNEDETDTA